MIGYKIRENAEFVDLLKWKSRSDTQDTIIAIQKFIILIFIDISIKIHQFVMH